MPYNTRFAVLCILAGLGVTIAVLGPPTLSQYWAFGLGVIIALGIYDAWRWYRCRLRGKDAD